MVNHLTTNIIYILYINTSFWNLEIVVVKKCHTDKHGSVVRITLGIAVGGVVTTSLHVNPFINYKNSIKHSITTWHQETKMLKKYFEIRVWIKTMLRMTLPSRLLIAALALSSLEKVTNAKPLHLPVVGCIFNLNKIYKKNESTIFWKKHFL